MCRLISPLRRSRRETKHDTDPRRPDGSAARTRPAHKQRTTHFVTFFSGSWGEDELELARSWRRGERSGCAVLGPVPCCGARWQRSRPPHQVPFSVARRSMRRALPAGERPRKSRFLDQVCLVAVYLPRLDECSLSSCASRNGRVPTIHAVSIVNRSL